MTRQKYIFTVLLIIIAGLICQVWWMGHNEDLRRQELKINQSYSAGLLEGAGQGAIEVFNMAYRDGIVMMTMDNQTYALYSPDGCVAAVQAAQGAGA